MSHSHSLSKGTDRGAMTNRQLIERVIGDLNELIDKRGNAQLIATLIGARGFLSDIEGLERLIRANAAVARDEL